MEQKVKRILFILSITLFICALTQNCYCTNRSCVESMYVFFGGPIAVMGGGAALTWLANPFLLISWINFRRDNRLSLYTSLISTAICLTFLMFKNVIVDEAGHYEFITTYEAGYWLWVASSLSMLACNSNSFFKTPTI